VGSGFRTFTAGEVLTASNVQNYLMDQSVMVFGGSAARSSAIGTANFEEGMVSYLTDTDKVEAYNGTDWVSVAPTTSQCLTLINTTSFSAVASQSVNDVFSATYDEYLLKVVAECSGSTVLNLRFRVSGADDTSSLYDTQRLRQVSTTVSGEQSLTANLAGLNIANTQNLYLDVSITRPFNATVTTYKSFNANGANQTIAGGIHNSSTSFTGFTVFPAAGTMTGSVSVYGYNK
jgi:hypothetical protein